MKRLLLNYKKQFIAHLAFSFAAVLLVACGGGTNPDKSAEDAIPETQKISAQKFHFVENADGLTIESGSLSGSGSIRFAEDLGTSLSDYHYHFEFMLDDGGSLTLFSHADTELKNGFEINFKRSGNVLSVLATAQAMTQDWTEHFAALDAASELSIGIDVHNSEPLTHVIVWDESTENEVLDTAEDIDGGPGNGLEQNWGLKLSNAKVLSIEKDDPEHSHDD